MRINYDSWTEDAGPGIEMRIPQIRRVVPNVKKAAKSGQSIPLAWIVLVPLAALLPVLIWVGTIQDGFAGPLSGILLFVIEVALLIGFDIPGRMLRSANRSIDQRWDSVYRDTSFALRSTSLALLIVSDETWKSIFSRNNPLRFAGSLMPPRVPARFEEYMYYGAAYLDTLRGRMLSHEGPDSDLDSGARYLANGTGASVGAFFGGTGNSLDMALVFHARLCAILDFFEDPDCSSLPQLGWREYLQLRWRPATVQSRKVPPPTGHVKN
jgi:hypothetical protein